MMKKLVKKLVIDQLTNLIKPFVPPVFFEKPADVPTLREAVIAAARDCRHGFEFAKWQALMQAVNALDKAESKVEQ